MNTARQLARKAREVAALRSPDDVPPSPCLSVCRMDAASGLCEGCLRTLDEIAAWGLMDNAGKRGVWASIRERAQRQEQA